MVVVVVVVVVMKEEKEGVTWKKCVLCFYFCFVLCVGL